MRSDTLAAIAWSLIIIGAIFILATIFCGCAGWRDMTPMDAYRIESAQCARMGGEAARRCQSLVEKKYARYLAEGSYPSPTPGRACAGSQDCR